MMFTKASRSQNGGGSFAALFSWAMALLLLAGSLASAQEMARSADGNWLAIANRSPDEITIYDSKTMQVARQFEVIARDGKPSRVEGIYVDPTRRHFIVTLQDAPEYWLIATDPNAPPVFEGFVHNNENGMTEGQSSSEGLFALKRIYLAAPVGDLVFSPDYRTATGLRPDKHSAVVINLNVNREIDEYEVP